MKHISVTAFKEVLLAEQDNNSIDFINVCEPAEYKEKHIEGVRSVPLGTVTDHVQEFNSKQTVYVHCRSGNRGKQAIDRLIQAGVTAELVNVEGGLLAWDEAGYDTGSHTSRMPIMRQVLVAAGSLILIGFVGTYTISDGFKYLAPLVGVGLLFAGVSGWCGMAFVLTRMPWNK